MKNINVFVNAGGFTVTAWTWETSQAWGHEATILKDNQEMGRARVRYYNRTWEAWTYQSVIRSAIENIIDRKCEKLENEKRDQYGGRLPRGTKQEIRREVEARDDIKAIMEAWRNFNKVEA